MGGWDTFWRKFFWLWANFHWPILIVLILGVVVYMMMKKE